MTTHPFRAPLLLLLVFVGLSLPVLARTNALEQLLDPFQGLDFESLYEDHAAVIDFGLYFLVFLGLAQVTLSRQFPGRGGKALVAGMALVLALSLSLSGRLLNFSLRSFGPLAASILVVLVGAVLYHAIQRLGFRKNGSGALAFVVCYFALRGVSPNLFDWLSERLPFVNGLLSLSVLVALAYALFHLWPAGGFSGWGDRLQNAARQAWAAPMRGAFSGEENFIQKNLAPIVRKERKTSQEIQEDLKLIQRALGQSGGSPNAWPFIGQKLREIAPKEHALKERLRALMVLSQRLEKFEIRAFERLWAQYQKLPKEAQGRVRKQLLAEKAKILDEKKLKNLAALAAQHETALRNSLEGAAKDLLAGSPNEAKTRLDMAIAHEQQAGRLLEEMQALEERLLALTRRELKA